MHCKKKWKDLTGRAGLNKYTPSMFSWPSQMFGGVLRFQDPPFPKLTTLLPLGPSSSSFGFELAAGIQVIGALPPPTVLECGTFDDR